jgi:hypothetical protein
MWCLSLLRIPAMNRWDSAAWPPLPGLRRIMDIPPQNGTATLIGGIFPAHA